MAYTGSFLFKVPDFLDEIFDGFTCSWFLSLGVAVAVFKVFGLYLNAEVLVELFLEANEEELALQLVEDDSETTGGIWGYDVCLGFDVTLTDGLFEFWGGLVSLIDLIFDGVGLSVSLKL